MEPKEKVKYITDEDGNKTSVVLPVETYEGLLEDINDLVSIVERKDEESVPLDEVINNLKADDLL